MTLPPPFNKDLKVLVLAGANQVPAGNLYDASHHTDGETPLEAKSFLRLRGRLIIEYVLDWILEAGLRRIWVLAPEQCLATIPAEYEFRGPHSATICSKERSRCRWNKPSRRSSSSATIR